MSASARATESVLRARVCVAVWQSSLSAMLSCYIASIFAVCRPPLPLGCPAAADGDACALSIQKLSQREFEFPFCLACCTACVLRARARNRGSFYMSYAFAESLPMQPYVLWRSPRKGLAVMQCGRNTSSQLLSVLCTQLPRGNRSPFPPRSAHTDQSAQMLAQLVNALQ